MNVISLVAFMFLSNLFFVQIAVLHDLNLLKIKTGNPVPLVKLHEDVGRSSYLDFIDIDSEHRDAQMCTTYVTEIYANMRVIEVCTGHLLNFFLSHKQLHCINKSSARQSLEAFTFHYCLLLYPKFFEEHLQEYYYPLQSC